METNGKRKHDASGAQGSSLKRSKGGNQGKWMTPSHKAKLAAIKGRTLEVGDMGFWVTCQRMKEMKAADEILSICEEYGQRLFGIASDAADDAAEDDEPEDIEVAIEKEIATMESANKTKNSVFDLIRMNVDCVLFMRTRAPVDPLKLVREICKDAAVANDRKLLRSRFINKLTPITLTGKATEKGLEDVAKKILSDHFRMADDETDTENDGENEAYSVSRKLKARKTVPLSIPITLFLSPISPIHFSSSSPRYLKPVSNQAQQYAIRPTLRAHSSLKRTEVIDKVANMISKRHKVDLKNPDKVIIIEIFQTFCGMSVVGKDWEAMKRYNIHELYSAALKSAADPGESEEAKEGEGDGQA